MLGKVKFSLNEYEKLCELEGTESWSSHFHIEPGRSPGKVTFRRYWSESSLSIDLATTGGDPILQGHIVFQNLPHLTASDRSVASYVELESAGPDKLVIRVGDRVEEVPRFAPNWLIMPEGTGPFSITMGAPAISAMLGPRWKGKTKDYGRVGWPVVNVDFRPSTDSGPPVLVSTASHQRRVVQRTIVLPSSPFERFRASLVWDVVPEIRKFNSRHHRLRLTFWDESIVVGGSRGTLVLPMEPVHDDDGGDALLAVSRVPVASFQAKHVVLSLRKLARAAGPYAFEKSWPKDKDIRISWKGERFVALSLDTGAMVHLACGEVEHSGTSVFDLGDLGRALSAFGDAVVEMRVPIGEGAEPPWIEFVEQGNSMHVELVQALDGPGEAMVRAVF